MSRKRSGRRNRRPTTEAGTQPRKDQRPQRLPKLCGADVELGNFIVGGDLETDTCHEASHALIREIEGLPLVSRHHAAVCVCGTCRAAWPASWSATGTASDAQSEIVYDSQDWGRRYLAENGGCAYVDLNHLEICLPEVLSARDYLAAWHAMLRIARRALKSANARQPEGHEIQVLVANSDGFGHSYGSHNNFLITRQAWNNLFHRKLHHLLSLATYQVSSIIFAGQGKVGSENGASPVAFQLSQRADFFETLTSEATTFRRPIVNSRNEALCGRPGAAAWQRGERPEGARLHVIFYDSTLSHVATYLKVGVMQIILAMLEAETLPADLLLDDPLRAVRLWSHDVTLRARARTVDGRMLTALEVQWLFLEAARRFARAGGCDGIVPDHDTILDLWQDTLTRLEARDLTVLARRLDWALKLLILRRAMQQHRIEWNAPQIKHLDLAFGNLDEESGLYWAYEKAGLVERLVTDARIDHFVDNPPEATRAWTRAMLLRRAEPHQVDDVDWDRIRFRTAGTGLTSVYRTLHLGDPLGFTRAATAALFDGTASLDDLLDRLGAGYDDASPGSLTGGAGATGATELTAITTGRPAEGWPIHKGGQNGHEIP